MKYPDEAGAMWRAFVPRSGQATTVQGELIRAVEKLRDEATRNGNINWDAGFETLARYVRDTLVASGVFDAKQVEEINGDARRLLRHTDPETDAAIYDRLTDRIVEWYRRNPEPIPRPVDPALRR